MRNSKLKARGRRRLRRLMWLFFEPLEPRALLSADGLPTIGDLALSSITPAVHQNVTNTIPRGYTPAQIRNAYGFNQITFVGANGQTVQGSGAGQTIAIVDAYGDPNLVSDLKVFDSTFGLSNNDGTGQDLGADATGLLKLFQTNSLDQGEPLDTIRII